MASVPARTNGHVNRIETPEPSPSFASTTNALAHLHDSVAQAPTGFGIVAAFRRNDAQCHAADVVKHTELATRVVRAEADLKDARRQAALAEVEDSNKLRELHLRSLQLDQQIQALQPLDEAYLRQQEHQLELELSHRVRVGTIVSRHQGRQQARLRRELDRIEGAMTRQGFSRETIEERKRQTIHAFTKAWEEGR